MQKTVMLSKFVLPKVKPYDVDITKRIGLTYQEKSMVITGGAAMGKTTLAARIAKQFDGHVCYMALDDKDNDVWMFFYGMLHMLKAPLGAEFESLKTMFESVSKQEHIQEVLTFLFNVTHQLPPVMLIFDDCQHINDNDLIDGIHQAMKHASSAFKFVFLSRQHIPFHLEEAVVKHDVLVIDETMLKLTESEVITLLNHHGIEGEVALSMQRLADGWPGGLRLVMHAYQRLGEAVLKQSKLDATATHYIQEQLFKEVSPSHQRVFVKLAPFQVFDEQIIAEVCDDQAVVFSFIKMCQSFTLVRVLEDGVYKLQPLFQQFLMDKFEQLSLDVKTYLLKRQVAFYSKHGRETKALDILFQLKHYEEAAHLINQNDGYQYVSYLRRLPLDVVIKDASLTFKRAFYEYMALDFEAGNQLCDCYLNHKQATHKTLIRLLKAVINQDNIHDLNVSDQLKHHPSQLLSDLLDTLDVSLTVKTMVELNLGGLLFFNEAYQDALLIAKKANQIAHQQNHHYMIYFATALECQIHEQLGNLNSARRAYRSMERLYQNYPQFKTIGPSLYAGEAGVDIKQGRFNDAVERLDKALSVGHDDYALLQYGYLVNHMEIKTYQGLHQEATHDLDQLLKAMPIEDNPFFGMIMKYIMYLKVDLNVYVPMFMKAYETRQASQALRADDQMAMVLILIDQQQYAQALENIKAMIGHYKQANHKLALVESFLIKATLKTVSDSEAMHAFIEAVYYAKDDNIISYFLLHKPWLKQTIPKLYATKFKMLDEASQRFIHGLTNRLDLVVDHGLSSREMDVLRAFKLGLNNQDLAMHLHVSLSTLKTHINKIFSKLNVKNKVEALNKAYEKGILKKD